MWGKNNNPEESIQCSLTGAPTTYLEPTPRAKIELLMSAYPHQEWLAYLTGRISEKANIFVEDIVVPPHSQANGGSAEAEPLHTPKNCVGIIHSHHGMGTFHSGTDQSYVDKNYPASIVVARNSSGNLEYDGVSYAQTPCGKNIALKSSVKNVQPRPLFDQDSFLKQAKENIDKGKKVYVHPAPAQEGTKTAAPFLPLRYRRDLPYSDFNDYVTDERGNVLTKKELEEVYKQIWRD